MITARFSPSLDWRDFIAFAQGLFARENLVEKFETAFAEYVGRKHAIAVPSARAGLHFLLRTCGPTGGKAIIPAWTYYAVPAVSRLSGFMPRFVDVRPETLLMDEEQLAAIDDPEVKVIIPTHLYGRVQDMDAVMKVAKDKGWIVIEDVAQGLGAKWNGKMCGAFGDAAYFTFGPTKNFTTLGGAMIVTDDDAWAERLRAMIAPTKSASKFHAIKAALFGLALSLAAMQPLFGMFVYPLLRWGKPRGFDLIEKATSDPPHDYPLPPPEFYKNNINNAQAAVGLRQLKKVDGLNDARAVNGRRMLALLDGAEKADLPSLREGESPIFMSFPMQIIDPDGLAKELIKHGVDTTRGYMSYGPGLEFLQPGSRDTRNAFAPRRPRSHQAAGAGAGRVPANPTDAGVAHTPNPNITTVQFVSRTAHVAAPAEPVIAPVGATIAGEVTEAARLAASPDVQPDSPAEDIVPDYPHARHADRRVLHLPVHPGVRPSQVGRIAKVVLAALRRY
ncbi:MAG: DegT/DnrJ/EryC1/StrS family aminotransferase [Deltaproteobacteria bacterium]|nr:DegT/DnrJ/EryC1/StrS family aminotransferase [Deltaproteobacteria bacterium]